MTTTVITYTENFESYPSQTLNPGGWASNDTGRGGCEVYYNPSFAHGGSKALSVHNSDQTADNITALSKTLTGLTTGRSYTLSAWAKLDTSGLDKLYCYIGVSGVGQSTASYLGSASAQVQKTYTFTATATSHTIQLCHYGDTYNGDVLFWDDVQVTWEQPDPAVAPSAPTPAGPSTFVTNTSQTLSWSFNGNNTGDYQTAYQLVITKSGTTFLDTGKVSSGSSAYYTAANQFPWGSYTWKVRVWDSTDLVSSYSATTSFSVTDINRVPDVRIDSVTPANPTTGQTVTVDFTYVSNETSRTDPMQAYNLWVGAGSNTAKNQAVYTDPNSAATTGTPDQHRVILPASFMQPGVSYQVMIEVQDTYGNAWSPINYGYFSTPGTPSVTVNSYTGIDPAVANTVSWTYSSGTGGGYQASYTVAYQLAGASSWTTLTSGTGSSVRSATIPASLLRDNVTYNWRVTVTSSTTGSAQGVGTIATTFVEHDPTVTIGALTQWDAALPNTVTWTYADVNYNDPQSTWQVQIKNGSTLVWDSRLQTGTANSVVVPAYSLSNGTTYSLSVTVADSRWGEKVAVAPVAVNDYRDFDWLNAGWTPGTPAATITKVSTPLHGTNTQSLRLQVSNSSVNPNQHGLTTTTLTGLTPGKSTSITAWATSPSTTSLGQAAMYVVGSAVPSTVVTTNSNVWVQVVYTFTPTSDTHSLALVGYWYLGGAPATANTYTAYWSDFVIQAGTKMTDPVYNTTPVTATATAPLIMSYPPDAPTITPHADFDASTAQTFAWTFSDVNAGDTQSAYQVQIQSADGLTTLVDTGKVVSNAKTYTLQPNVLVAGSTYRWHAYVWDSHDNPSTPSIWDEFATAAPVTVTIAAPTDYAQFDTNSVVVSWTFATSGSATQQSYRVKVINENNQVALIDTGNVASTATTYTATGISSNVPYRIEVSAISSASVSSPVATTHFTSFFNSPMIAGFSVDVLNEYNLITITNPTPSGSRPATTKNEIYRAKADSNSYELLATVGPNGTFQDYYVAGATSYTYYVRSYAANGQYLNADPFEASTETIQGVTLFSPADPASFTKSYLYGNIGRQESITASATSRTYVTGVHPEYTFSGNNNKTLGLSFTIPFGDTHDTDLRSLTALVRARMVVVYKDGRGRFLTGVITSLSVKDEKYGTTVSGDFLQTAYSTLNV